ncbi:MAG: 30S ribosomal protein S15 [Candidatus Kaiserbacteria bacterium]|nr:30S ribosomal protein S15 [Candidatus Kaiserbacteria bacterium]
MLTKEEKQTSIATVQNSEQDTGSSAVQVSVLTARIKKLDDHLKQNRKDLHARRGLVGLVSKRRKHLSYLKQVSQEAYDTIVKKLALRG